MDKKEKKKLTSYISLQEKSGNLYIQIVVAFWCCERETRNHAEKFRSIQRNSELSMIQGKSIQGGWGSSSPTRNTHVRTHKTKKKGERREREQNTAILV